MLSHKPFTELDESDLQALVADRRPESRSLDYKRDLNFTKDDERRELARDLSSFANASGGDLVYGVEEAKDSSGKPLGYPSSLVGVAGNFDDIKLRIENIARDLIDPRIQGMRGHKVEGPFPNGPIIIVRVPRSWIGPHMLAFQKTDTLLLPQQRRAPSARRTRDQGGVSRGHRTSEEDSVLP